MNEVALRFDGHVAAYKDLEYPGLLKELGIDPLPKGKLSFAVERAKRYSLVTDTLKLNAEERRLLGQNGFVSVDHGKRYSMASAYAALYGRDLPVLITTDSILHALHRSYDNVLMELELELFTQTIAGVLESVHAQLPEAEREARSEGLRESLRDIEVYLTVARNLLAGGGAPADEPRADSEAEIAAAQAAFVPSKLGQDELVRGLLAKITALVADSVDGPGTKLHGSRRYIDYSQFRARGHYTTTPQLRRYFRAMMWLGRPDLGFLLQPPKGPKLNQSDASRERRAAAAFVKLLESSGQLKALRAMSDIVDFMVGRSDDLGVKELEGALGEAGIARLSDLEDATAFAKLTSVIERMGAGRGLIRGQIVVSKLDSPAQTTPPKVFQVFGQRFALDSFLLSRVVFDSILFQDRKRKRMMPSGLDVMAAFGNDEAVRILRPEIERHQYAANLAAARRTVSEQPPQAWNDNLYGIWLDALRTLDDVPGAKAHFPEAMRTSAWRKKKLETQLASWAELRHDTILYAKQSYTAVPGCGYPAGYVEPYPAFFKRLGELTAEAARRLSAADVSHVGSSKAEELEWLRKREVMFFENFARRMTELERLASKELAAQPFTKEEEEFLKKTVNRTIVGSGGGVEVYTGWYAELIYGGAPELWKPTVADVHTDPASGRVLEQGVGDVNFLVVAIDNEDDRAIYVGPAYSYYEFSHDRRMTNEEWASTIQTGRLPSRPQWTREFMGPAQQRNFDGPERRPSRFGPGP